MSMTVIPVFILTFLTSFVRTSPTITTTPSPMTKNNGDTVWMLCQVTGLTTEIVQWKFLTQNKLISKGGELQVHGNHYKIETLQGETSDAPASYILHIFNLESTDHGLYTCSVDGFNQTVTYNLMINSVPQTTPPTVHDYNFTDCCVSNNISPSCKPVCSPMAGLPEDFDPLTACITDLPTLLKCGSDGKNHVPCCKRREIPDICLDFCLGQIPATLDNQHLYCLNFSMDTIMCYEEGQDYLPDPPTSISSVARTDAPGFVISWQPPTDNVEKVKGYYIHYKLSADTTYKTSAKLSPQDRTYQLNDVLPNKLYSIYMSAFSDYGSSQPSEIITQATLGGLPEIEHDLNIKACCNKTKMPSTCQEHLCKSDVFEDLDPQIVLSCYGYLDEALKCVTGKRNHTGCCQRNSIPEHCLGFCAGEIPPINDDVANCMLKLPLIEACVKEGLETIPGPPESVRLTEVKQTTATLTWKPPSSGANVTQYIVAYIEHSLEDKTIPNFNTTTETSIQLTGLVPNTEYDVTVVSSNDAGESLKSPTIGFLTYAVSPTEPPVTPSPGPVLPYNLSVCCTQKGLQSSCMKLCDYDFIINAPSSELYPLALACSNQFDLVIECGSDGRDHRQCCTERNVPTNCLSLCTGNMKDADILCAFEAPKISQCFREGIVDLPRPPTGVNIYQTTSHTVTVSWSKPNRGPTADHYYVFYKTSGQTDQEVIKERVNTTSYIIQNLESGYVYVISVVSGNSEGYSIPSPSFSVYIPPDTHTYNCTNDFTANSNKFIDLRTVSSTKLYKNKTVDVCKQECVNSKGGDQCTGFVYNKTSSDCIIVIGKYGHQITQNGVDFYARTCDFETPVVEEINKTSQVTWTNQQECCEHHNISEPCMQYCQTGNAFSYPQQCENEFSTVVACASDGKNHSMCCQQAGVPEICLPYCWGAVMDSSHPVTQLCLSYTRMFVTCFTQGARTIPSIPQRFRVTEEGTTFLVLAWEKPTDNCNDTNCKYDIQWTSDNNDGDTIYGWTNTTKNLTNLQPESLYHIAVSATNTFGSSLSSPIISARTQPIVSFEVNFYLRPGAVIDTGKSVRLICEVFGATDATVSIIFHTKVISTSKDHTIQTVSKADDGEYTCSIKKTPNDDPVIKKLNLLVRYKPSVTSIHGDKVEPDAGKSAFLQCVFVGIPTYVSWKKDGELLVNQFYMTHTNILSPDGTFISKLTIFNVREEMFGSYECNGTNAFGYGLGHALLQNAYTAPTRPPPPTGTPEPVKTNFSDCCMKDNVQGVCLELCHFNVNFSIIFDNKYDACVQLLPIYASCAADGKDHSKCCTDHGIKDYCMPYCKGSAPDMSDTAALLTCVDDAVKIVDCLESGQVLIPSAPQNVQAVQKGGTIHVTWDPPKLSPANIKRYIVSYNTSVASTPLSITLASNAHEYKITKIPGNSNGLTYYIWVTAENDYGKSQPGKPATPVVISDVPPLPPKDLQATKVDGTTIYLQWTAPSYIDNINKYIVKYKVSITNEIPTELEVTDKSTTKATLKSLLPNTMYEIFVVGRSQQNVEGQPSNTITIPTGSTETGTDKSRGGKDSGGNGGVIAVVVIIILVLAGAAVAGIIYYRRRNRHKFSEAVTFENPQYGSSQDSQIKISGLPTDNSDDNPFGYSPLQEDNDDHYSSPMLDVDQVEFKPRK